MPKRVRRFDLYLPTRYNDGRKIEFHLFKAVEDRLLERFGGVTFVPRQFALHGLYRGTSRIYRDRVVIFTVFEFAARGAIRFIRTYKTELEARFDQELVLITMQELTVF